MWKPAKIDGRDRMRSQVTQWHFGAESRVWPYLRSVKCRMEESLGHQKEIKSRDTFINAIWRARYRIYTKKVPPQHGFNSTSLTTDGTKSPQTTSARAQNIFWIPLEYLICSCINGWRSFFTEKHSVICQTELEDPLCLSHFVPSLSPR
jgi:hypothetical protein